MRKIAVIGGGNSSEFQISIKSAEAVIEALTGKYECYLIYLKGSNWYWEDKSARAIPINKNDFSLNLPDKKVRFDAAFIAIHGSPGEDGLLQGYLDMIGIPYSSCDAFCSALTFNKHACKLYLKEYNIPMARSIKIKHNMQVDKRHIIETCGLPCFVKPNASGSSFGVSKVDSEDKLQNAINLAFKESSDVLIESNLEGIEVGCGVFKSKHAIHILPITEIISKNEFFDYEAKYLPGQSEEITPARLKKDVYKKVHELSSQIYDILACNGVVRIDFIIVDDNPLFLEINSIPGMTKESIIPKQINAYGILPSEFYSEILESLF